MRIAVLGVGLIGGSIGLAARERLGAEVSGWDPSGEALAAAVARGAVSRACATTGEAVDGVDAVFCAAPVGALAGLVADALADAGTACVVSDVGSTKRAVLSAIEDPRFIGGHPLTGAETAGVASARPDLFDGATWYLTPRVDTPAELYARLAELVRGLGARPVEIDPGTHDRVLAAVSHLPHVLANVLVAQAAVTLAEGVTAGGERLAATAPSFRDATRVAGAPSAIWTDIYLANRDALLSALDGVLDRLQDVRAALRDGDAQALTAWNDAAARDRGRLRDDETGEARP